MKAKCTTARRRRRSTVELTDARARILTASEHASAIFRVLQEIGPSLDEPERGAALELRGQAADLCRRLGNLAAFLGAPR